MFRAIHSVVVSYDIFFLILISRSVYLVFWRDREVIVENKITVDRVDPEFMTQKELFSLLDSRGEVYSRTADRRRLVALAKSKVSVEESESPDLADLHSMSVEELKQLLNDRGVMFYSKSSRQDLMMTVNISGPVTKAAFEHMKKVGEPRMERVQEFNAFNIVETLNKYNDTIFLINIIPHRRKYAYFKESSWQALIKKLSYMNFKFGELDCDFEKSICLRYKWNTSVLYLSVPSSPKEDVQFTITENYSIHAIFTSIQKTVSSRISHIDTWDEFTSSKWAYYYGPRNKIRVRVILFTNMIISPLFLSVLSVKYREKVNFGIVNIESKKGRTILRKLKQEYRALCLVVTQQGILTYGKLPGEYFTHRDLDNFLQSLLQGFESPDKWYDKFLFLLDPLLIMLLILRFLTRTILMAIPFKVRSKQETDSDQTGKESDFTDEKHGDNLQEDTHKSAQDTRDTDRENLSTKKVRFVVNRETLELIEMLRQRNSNNNSQ